MNLSQPPELNDPRLKDWLYLLWKKVIENQNSESQASVLSVSNGGTGKASLTGYLIGNGASPFTAIGKIPYSDLSGAPQNKSYGLNIDALDKTAAPGIYVITNFGGSATRTITGTTNRISITNGDGVAGNPTINIAATYIGQNTITTLGTITTGVWQGTSISTTYTDAKLKTLTGTSNRITVSGTSTDPIVDISATYVGQASITTLGTITTGTWNAGQITSNGTITGTQLISTVSTGTAPLVVASTTNIANLNASQLLDATWSSPGQIGRAIPNSGAFTTLQHSNNLTPTTTNSYDIGDSTHTERDVWIGRNVYLATTINNAPLNVGAASGVSGYFAGSIGIGVTPTSDYGIRVVYTGSSSTDQYGCLVDIFGNSSATNVIAGYRSRVRTSAASFTANLGINFYCIDGALGGGSAITTQVGLFVDDLTVATNNRGLDLRVLVGTNKYNIYAGGTAQNYIAGRLGLGSSSSAPAAALDIGNSITASSWTTSGIGLRLRGNTFTDSSTASSGTAATNHIHAIAAPTLAASNTTVTTTTAATLYIANAPTAGTNMTITNKYALYLAAGSSFYGGSMLCGSTVTCTAGTGTGQPILSGKLNVNTTVVGNVGGGTDDLMTYSLPANSLNASAKGVRIKAWGAFANNANAKTLTFNFGSKTISLATTLSINGAWASDIIVFSTGSNAQIIFIDHKVTTLNSTASASNALYEDTATQTDSSSITIKYTAVGTADNDVTQKGMLIEFFN